MQWRPASGPASQLRRRSPAMPPSVGVPSGGLPRPWLPGGSYPTALHRGDHSAAVSGASLGELWCKSCRRYHNKTMWCEHCATACTSPYIKCSPATLAPSRHRLLAEVEAYTASVRFAILARFSNVMLTTVCAHARPTGGAGVSSLSQQCYNQVDWTATRVCAQQTASQAEETAQAGGEHAKAGRQAASP